MARGTVFIVGEVARRASLEGGDITVRLTPNGYTNRARAAPRYEVAVHFSEFPELGFVVMDDSRGHVEHMKFEDVAKWLAKYLCATNCAINIEVPDASLMAVGYTQSRLTKHNHKFSLVDISEMTGRAADLLATVINWVSSPRKSQVVQAAANINKCAALVEWLRSGVVVPEPEPEEEDPDGEPGGGGEEQPPSTGPVVNPPSTVATGEVGWLLGRYKNVLRGGDFAYNLGRVLEIFETRYDPALSVAEYLFAMAPASDGDLLMVDPASGEIVFVVTPDTAAEWINEGPFDWQLKIGGLSYMGFTGGGPTVEQTAHLGTSGDVAREVRRLNAGAFGAYASENFGAHYGALSDGYQWPATSNEFPASVRKAFALSEVAANAGMLSAFGSVATGNAVLTYSVGI